MIMLIIFNILAFAEYVLQVKVDLHQNFSYDPMYVTLSPELQMMIALCSSVEQQSVSVGLNPCAGTP